MREPGEVAAGRAGGDGAVSCILTSIPAPDTTRPAEGRASDADRTIRPAAETNEAVALDNHVASHAPSLSCTRPLPSRLFYFILFIAFFDFFPAFAACLFRPACSLSDLSPSFFLSFPFSPMGYETVKDLTAGTVGGIAQVQLETRLFAFDPVI